MTWDDLRRGVVVYHRTFTHWGRGVVLRVDGAYVSEGLFERGDKRAVIEFAGRRDKPPAKLKVSELRKNPNKKKMKQMVQFYQQRGIDASIDGDSLIIPKRVSEASDNNIEGESK